MSEPVDDGPPGVPEWVVTYGDMMSLLLTFFIMLVSMSQLKDDSGRVRAMMDSMEQRFGPTDGDSANPGDDDAKTGSNTDPASKGAGNEGGSEAHSRDSDGLSGPELTVERVRDGTIVTLGGPTMFDLDSATPTPELREGIDVLAEVLGEKSNRIVVRGHASPEELESGPKASTEFPDRYALSFARASNVADALIAAGIAPERIMLSAVGDAEPRVVTRDDALRQRNRRVDVFVVDSYTTAAQPSETARP